MYYNERAILFYKVRFGFYPFGGISAAMPKFKLVMF